MPKANKRFLSAIIRNTDEHNKAVLKAQADAAQEAKAEREEQLRIERRARAKEAELSRRHQGGSSRRDIWRSSDDTRERSSKSRRHDHYESEGRPEENRSSRHRKRHRSRSRSNEHRHRESTHHSRRRHHDDSDTESVIGESSKSRHRHERRDRDRDGNSSRERSGSKTKGTDKHEHTSRDGRRGNKDDRKKRRKHSPESVEDRDHALGWREGSQQPEDSGDSVSSRKTTESRALTDPSSSKLGKLSGSSTPRFDSVRGSRGTTSDTSNSNRVAQVRAKANDLSEQFRRREEARASPPPPASPTLSEEEDIGWLLSRRNKRALAEPRPQDSPVAGSSKMDKYFEESYDPRLDVGPLSIPTVPTTGLIEGNEFERWEAMLDIIRQRREDKAERKRMERLGISKEKEKSKGTSEAWTMSEGVSVMDIKYNKRGATREWDMGKDLT